jgi:thymidylate synthase
MSYETQYLNLLRKIINKGQYRTNRTNVNTYSLFGESLSFDLQTGFPLLTTRKMYFKGIFTELMWFLRGQTNSKILESKNVNIWKGNTSREFLDSVGLNHLLEGEIGKGYGYQWRNITDANNNKCDQIINVINLLKTDPFSRRILVNSWNVSQLKDMALPPCHYSFQFYVDYLPQNTTDSTNETTTDSETNSKLRLNCLFNMRSCDVFHGLPFNIASYALLTHLIALECNMQPGILKCMLCDAHIYESHLNSINTQLERSPYMFPKIQINKLQNIFDYELSDITLIDYKYHDSINEKMVV